MEKRDFRSLGRETQEALRVRAVFLVLQLHKTQAEAAEAVGVSRQIVNQWMRNYASEGEKALLDRRTNAHRRGKGRRMPKRGAFRAGSRTNAPNNLNCLMRYGPRAWFGN